MDSSDYSDAAKAELRDDINKDVTVFLQRLQSVGADDKIDDFEVQNIGEEAYRLYTPTAAGSPVSGSTSGTTKDSIAKQIADHNDEAHRQILSRLKKKELSKLKSDKKAQMGKLRESMVEIKAESHGLLWDAELRRLIHTPGDISTDVEMNKILDQYRANEMEFHQLDAKYKRLEKELRKIQREKRKRRKSCQ
ncbi:hypothetical protein FVEN_g2070 [Fusarium venenatum]|uniref:Uncharacterized protein n=1 Tax=Fusarium venenatum TaxID=56646 RepID=A0A2L2T3H7_9HYPO|nr:uncharacterized protein FVRRES_12480 [Fusarium venenatum]KAG8360440.1 hypothetical protein FVEN_g2070 [Fusarium venenatum]KAH6979094.1 hypothetical protein EDB82DRAFT_507059 [Fusarium venenatum]CEI39789.1 unnamed protein product [Fusarium venenatum]